MSDRHFTFWPQGHPRNMSIPATSLFYNAEVSAARYPDKPYLIFYDTPVSFAEFRDEAERIAGWLQKECGVKKGDRVLLFMQNSPQYVIGYYGILRADAVVVPVNPMNLTNELRHYVKDSGAAVALVSQELYAQMKPLMAEGLRHIVVAAYSDYLKKPTDLKVPEFVAAPRQPIGDDGVALWSGVLARNLRPSPMTAGPDDLALLPYTSGTTGLPKGCMHTHLTLMHNAVGGQWGHSGPESVALGVVPMFHITGMIYGVLGAVFTGCTTVILPRWDRELAGRLISRHQVSHWTCIPTMIIDLFASPNYKSFDLSSLRNLSGPITIADYAGQSARLGPSYYLRFLALISISLGVLNLLPIPVLDGGQLMYHIAEFFKGSPVSERVMAIGQQAGLAVLLGLTAFAFYNDIHRLLSG